jgi:TolB protein
VNTREITRLTNGGDNLGPSWSPDGEWIAFTSFRDGNNEIYVMRPDGSSLYNLTDNPISDWQPRWGGR